MTGTKLAATAVLLLLFWNTHPAHAQGCAGMLGGIGCDGSGQSCTYTASYAVQPDDTITFTVSATTAATNWVAIGVSDDQFMANTDVVLGATDGTNSFIQDRFATAQVEPPIDPSQDITSASASRVDGVTTITFNRPRDSGDSNDISLDVCRFFLFAFNGLVNFATQAAGYHGSGTMFRVASAERICIPTFAECIAGDTANVGFERTSYSVAEGESLTNVCASVQSGTLERDVVLTVMTSDGTATSTAPVDYTPIDSMLTIASGTTQECIPVVATTDDDIVEDDESFDISLSTADPDVNVTSASTTVTITEDADSVNVAFQEPSYTIPEGTNGSVCVTVVTGVLERDIMVTVSSVDDTAVEGDDYTMVNSVLTLNAAVGSACVEVATTEDDVLENDETFSISLTAADSAVMFGASMSTVVISNDDTVTIGFTEMTYAVVEGEMQEVRGRVLEGMIGPGVSVEVTVSSMDGTATAPADFTEVTAVWTFSDTVSEQNVSVSTAEDDILEGDQTFSVSLTTGSTDVMLDPHAAQVTITDDDTLGIAWQQPSYPVSEANSFVEVCVQSTGALERSVDITISTVPDTATAEDFTTLNMAPGTIAAGTDSSMCVNITIASDAIDETTPEMFTVEFATQDSGVTPPTGSTTVVIFDPPTLVPGQPADQSDVDPGTDVMFTVEAMGSDLTYQWQRDMSDIADGAAYAGTATSTLTVLDAREGDEGSYRCLVTNTVDSAPSKAAQLTVLDPPRITTQPSSVNNVNPGDNVTFSVVAEGVRLNYSWLFQEVELLGSDLVIGVNTPMLTIIDVEDSDMGNYRCVVSNAAGSETSDTAQLTFIGQPVIVENPMDVVVESGGTANFTCTATSNASLFFSWETTAIGVTLPDDVMEGSDPAVGITSTLTLMDVTVNHRGNYYCVVENERGNKSSLSATLTVVVIADINPPSQTVGYGVNASFNCMAFGSPDLAYSWETLGAVFVGDDSPRLISTDTPTLVITNVGPNDDGTYRCTLSVSGMEIGSREAKLITKAPVFVTELPDNLTISTGETLVLMCAAMNTVDSPDLNFIWYFNGINITLDIPRAVIESSEQDPVTRVANSNLTVPNINRNNDGRYTCKAYNRLINEGISSISDVTVEFLPVVTLSFPDGLRRNVGSDLVVLCIATGEPPVERIELLQNGVSVENTTGSTLSFSQSNLQLSDNGTPYICRAFNTRGNMSSSESFDVIVQDIPGLVNHSSVTVELITFFSARLMWPEPETNNGLNLRYNVTFCKIPDGDSDCGTGPLPRMASDRSIVLSELAINSTYQVTIQAENAVGVGPVPSIPSNETFTFETVDANDVILMYVNADIVTESRVVLSWEVPDIALDTPGVTEEFTVSYVRSGDDIVNSTNVPGNSLATVIAELDSDAEYTFSVTAVYLFNGGSLASTPVDIVNRTRVEDFAPATANIGEETPDGRFTISWSRPSGFQFLVQYVVNIFQTTLRRTVPVPRDDTSYDFQADPFTQYMVDVSGDFDVNGTTFSDPVAAPVTFQSIEQEFGFCDYEVSITSRGNYTWPETTGGSEVELECQLGPAVGVASDAAIGRRRCSTSGEWEDPQLENCITMVALQLQQLEELLNNTELTEENVGEVNQDLREVIDEAGEEDQTAENLQVVASVFTTTAALLSEPTVPVEEDTVNDIVEVLDTIQVWPEEVVEDMGSDIIEAFEEIVTSLVEQENFTNLTFVGDDLIFTAESVEVEILVNAGRGFSSSRDENGTLSTSGNVENEGELLAPEEIATAFLSPSLFEQFESDAGEVGIFFSLYESSSLFPIARETDSPTTAESEDDGGIMSQVGSPVVAATVSAGGQTEFRNLSDPVIVVLRLNTVLNGNITRRTCVSYDFNLADEIGNWTSEGCETSVTEDDPNIVTCSCNHLTNFACLVDICTRTEGCELTSAARVALEVLSIIGVVLSLVGTILTIITLLIFKTLRKRDATKFHIQLCIAILCLLLVFVIGIDRVPPKHPYGGCVAVSALIHYFTLAAVMWMGAEALLMFQKLVIVFRHISTKHVIMISIVCWVVPTIPVVIPLGIHPDFMVNRDSASDITFCFIGYRWAFFGAFLGPILAVLLFNLVIMVVVVTVLVRHMRNTMGRWKEQMKLKTAFRLLISITGIMSLFGLTWIFGALTISGASLPFQILFVVFNGFQGFFIFLFLCVSSKDARELCKESLSCGHYKSSKIHGKHQGTNKFSTGGTKRPKAATGTRIVAESVQKSAKPILSVVSDFEGSKNPHVLEDQMPTLGGGSSTFGHSNKRNEGGDIMCITNPLAIELLEIQSEKVQRPGSSALGSSRAESSSEEMRGANNPMVHGLSQRGQV